MKKNKNLFSNILSFFISIFKELYKTISLASYGLFKIVDLLINYILLLISYIFYGILDVLQYIGKFTIKLGSFMYNYVFKYIGIFLKYLLYTIPLFIIKKVVKVFKLIFNKASFILTHTPNTVKNYFSKKWDNLSVVKNYRNKKERELDILTVDKFGKDAEKSDEKRIYKYKAKNPKGRIVNGYLAAFSRLDAHSYLVDSGFIVYSLKTNWWYNFVHGNSKYIQTRVSNKDLTFWLAQLSTYIKSGISLIEAVKILAEQDKRKKYKKIYEAVIYELSVGESFSEALRKQGSAFPLLLINMVKAAELIGDLEGTLDDMSNYYNEKEITRKQMISALTYPSVILVLAVVVISFMLIYIVPEFSKVYSSINTEMHPLTQFLLNVSSFLSANLTFLILGLIIICVLISILYKKVKAFRMSVQFIAMHLPAIGKLIIYNEMNLFSKTFAALTKNNVPLTDSMEILSKITNNEYYKMIIYDTISNLLKGEKVSVAFKDNWAVPSLAYYMITTGESTGELGLMLDKVSEYYEREQRGSANTLKTLVEPLIMILLAGVVGFIMIAVLVPMYDMTSGIL